jgi:hypothetical protein
VCNPLVLREDAVLESEIVSTTNMSIFM